jgi:glycosyltransferase involved in cell wall biosynthesis
MAQKTKILYITANTAFGGVTFYTKSLVEEALRLDWDVTYETGQAKVKEELIYKKLKFKNFKYLDRDINLWKDLVSLFQLYFFIRKEKFEIVHTNTSKGGFIGRIAAKLANTKIVVHTVQGFAFHEFSSKKSIFVYSFLEKLAGYFSDKIIFVNKDDLNYALKEGFVTNDKIAYIPNGIDPNNVRFEESLKVKTKKELINELQIPENSILLGSIARITPQKGIYYLIEGFNLLKERKNIYLLIIGDGELKNELESNSNNPNIIFLGTRKDNARILNSLDIYVLPSLWEGLSLSLLEAMAVGLPIITTNIRGNREAINNENGLLVEPKSKADIYSAILKLLNDKEFSNRISVVAKKDFDLKYSLNKMIKLTFQLYKNA